MKTLPIKAAEYPSWIIKILLAKSFLMAYLLMESKVT